MMSDAVNSGRKRAAEVDVTKKPSAVLLTNDYSGFQPPAGIQRLTDRISPAITAEEFFTGYVEKRRPVVFGDLLVDDQWRGSDKWSLSYLSHKAGTSTIMVEDRPSSDDGSGDVDRAFQEMQYRDFVSALTKGETRYQLTNSDVQCSMTDLRDRNGFLSTVLQPLHTLADDFPLRPAVLGNLIPYQVINCVTFVCCCVTARRAFHFAR